MALVLKNLRGQIFWGATECECSVLNYFSEPEICKLNVAIGRKKDILWLQISVDDIFAVEILEN